MSKPISSIPDVANDTEYFLLASYSCLLTVAERLEKLRQEGEKTAVLFCFTEPIYKFLQPLADQFPWIQVHFINQQIAWRIKRPFTLVRARIQAKKLYQQWFAELPKGSIIHFYNRLEALFLFYIIWNMRDKYELHYTECDPVDMYEPYWSFKSRIQWSLFHFVYPSPFEMMRPKNNHYPITLPALPSDLVQRLTKKRNKRCFEASTLKNSSIYQGLEWHSNAKILWIMGMVLDMDEVEKEDYEKLLTQCYSPFPTSQQIIKFHPRATILENFGGNEFHTIPTYIPAEFLNLEKISAVITLSSTANTALSLAPNVQIVSLVELVPFFNEDIREHHRQAMKQATSQFYAPTTSEELHQIVRELRI